MGVQQGGEEMSDRLSRRKLLERSAVGGAALALPGVLKVPSGATAAHALGASPRKRKSLVVLAEVLAPGLDLDGRGVANSGSNFMIGNLYRGLVDVTRKRQRDILAPSFPKVDGELAQSWKRNGLEWTFQLRRNVRSAAGNLLTADDVIWTFARAKSVTGASTCPWALSFAGSVLPRQGVFGPGVTPETKKLAGEVVKVDDHTVRIKQFEPNELFPGVLSVFCTYIFDSKEAQKHATTDDPWAHAWAESQGAAGFGAYRLHSWRKDEAITLKAIPRYFRGQPQFETVTVSLVPHSATRVASILNGAADVVTGLSPREFQAVAKSDKVKVLSYFGNLYLALAMNHKAEPWTAGGNQAKARLLRQAVAYAIPYADILQKAFAGQARKWNGLINSAFYGSKQYPTLYRTDPSKARSLLAEAGFANGRGLDGPGLTLSFVAERQSILEPVATAVKTALARIGIEIELNPIPQTQFSDRQILRKDLPFYTVDTNVANWFDAGYMSQVFYVSAGRGAVNNHTNYSSEAFDALYLRQKDQRGAARLTLLRQMQDELMKDLPMVPIAERAIQVALRRDLTGWSPNPHHGFQSQVLRNLRTV
jgi:peptide/nickel transport system substrate-binding protein